MLVLMENNGLVTRDQHPTDGRARKVSLTRKGRRTYSKLSAEIKPLQDALLSPFQTKDAGKFTMFLNRTSEAMKRWERGHQTVKEKKVI
jgi:DNA-binding MarR family transcriptional regulator